MRIHSKILILSDSLSITWFHVIDKESLKLFFGARSAAMEPGFTLTIVAKFL